MKLNVGEGRETEWGRAHRDWTTLDGYLTADIEVNLMGDQWLRWGDLRGQSVDVAVCSHTLQYLDSGASESCLRRLRHYLVEGGTLRVTVPDADRAIDAYLSRDHGWFDGVCEIECHGNTLEDKFGSFFATYYDADGEERGVPLDRRMRDAVRRQMRSGHYTVASLSAHFTSMIPLSASRVGRCSGHSYATLARSLCAAGFQVVKRRKPMESREPELRGSGYDNRIHTSVYVEAWTDTFNSSDDEEQD
jgi:hypothetical protein